MTAWLFDMDLTRGKALGFVYLKGHTELGSLYLIFTFLKVCMDLHEDMKDRPRD